MKPRHLALMLVTYSLPFVLLEAGAQIVYAERLEHSTLVTRLLNIDTNRAYGLKPSDQSKILTYQDLYDWRSKPLTKTTRFRTDRFGTIEPSSLQAAIRSKGRFILFCGGSTTEGSFIKEGNRLPDVYARHSGMHAVNSGKSSKDLAGCIKTIEHTLG